VPTQNPDAEQMHNTDIFAAECQRRILMQNKPNGIGWHDAITIPHLLK
jgi:hypothetical protein